MERLLHVSAALRSAAMSVGTVFGKLPRPAVGAGTARDGAKKLARLGTILATGILLLSTAHLLRATTYPDVIYYVDSNQNVEELRFNGSSWSVTNLMTATSATSASPYSRLTGHLYGSSDNVWYIGTDYHVHELAYYGSPASWHTSDLTSLSGGPNAVLYSPLTSHTAGSSYDDVYYVASDGDIHELAFNGSTWVDSDITGAASAIGPSIATYTDNMSGEVNGQDNTESTFFVGTNGDVIQITFDESNSTWGTGDLTYTTNSPQPADGTNLISHMYYSSENVYFVDQNLDLRELAYYGSPASWNTSNVTAITGSSSPGSGSSPLSGYQNGSYDDVYFVISNADLFMDWYTGSTWKPTNVTSAASYTGCSSSGYGMSGHMWENTTPELFCFSGSDVLEFAFYSNKWHGSDISSIVSAPAAESGSPIVGFTGR